MPTSLSDVIAQTERALLGSVLLENRVWSQTAELSCQNFSLDSHRRIYARMASMFEDQQPVDLVTLAEELGGNDVEYISGLIDHALPENVPAYVRSVLQASRERQFDRLQEQLSNANGNETRLTLLEQMRETLTDSSGAHNWRGLFHSYDEVINAPTASFAIDRFLEEDGITFIGALAGHGKTLCMLSMVRALLEGGKLFSHFVVTKKAERVIYLIPEAGLGPFAAQELSSRRLRTPGKVVLSHTLIATTTVAQ